MLQEDLYSYLSYVIREYANRGIDPSEGQAIYYLNNTVKGARQVADSDVAKIGVKDSGDASLSVEPKDREKTSTLDSFEQDGGGD